MHRQREQGLKSVLGDKGDLREVLVEAVGAELLAVPLLGVVVEEEEEEEENEEEEKVVAVVVVIITVVWRMWLSVVLVVVLVMRAISERFSPRRWEPSSLRSHCWSVFWPNSRHRLFG